MRNISKIILSMFLLTSAALSSAANQARVPVTGESAGATGSANGTPWPSERFVGSGASNDCVSDKLTGLMWVKNLNTVIIIGSTNGSSTKWQNALDSVKKANADRGYCGYTDWRLPNINELKSLVNYGDYALPYGWLNTGGGFVNVQASKYWSSTIYAPNTNDAWLVHFDGGHVNAHAKYADGYVWPVRGGR
ncbi:MAG: DUF1566 domain-containing protein [Burkholderiales bacterium]|nr:DUF1566 domain-containing protein [Burkholderiales bacterium]